MTVRKHQESSENLPMPIMHRNTCRIYYFLFDSIESQSRNADFREYQKHQSLEQQLNINRNHLKGSTDCEDKCSPLNYQLGLCSRAINQINTSRRWSCNLLQHGVVPVISADMVYLLEKISTEQYGEHNSNVVNIWFSILMRILWNSIHK